MQGTGASDADRISAGSSRPALIGRCIDRPRARRRRYSFLEGRRLPGHPVDVVFSSYRGFLGQFDFLPERAVSPFLFKYRNFYESCPPTN
jgi:hypothetical protein